MTATTNIVFIVLWLVMVLPLIFFNIGKIKIQREGEKPKLNIVRLVSIILISILISFILFKTYDITLDYQPKLVTDRFINALTDSDYNNSKKEFEGLIYKDANLESIKSLYDVIPKKGGRYQLGSEVAAKYFYNREDFPSEGIKEDQKDVVSLIIRIDDKSGPYKYFILRLKLVNDLEWKVDTIMEASESALKYANQYDLIKSEHSATWYNL